MGRSLGGDDNSSGLNQIRDIGEFDAKIAKAQGTALVYFYADWCPPCKVVGPILSKLAVEYESRQSFYKVDLTEQEAQYEFNAKASVDFFPTVIFFKNGKEVSRIVGMYEESKYREEIEKLLK